ASVALKIHQEIITAFETCRVEYWSPSLPGKQLCDLRHRHIMPYEAFTSFHLKASGPAFRFCKLEIFAKRHSNPRHFARLVMIFEFEALVQNGAHHRPKFSLRSRSCGLTNDIETFSIDPVGASNELLGHDVICPPDDYGEHGVAQSECIRRGGLP